MAAAMLMVLITVKSKITRGEIILATSWIFLKFKGFISCSIDERTETSHVIFIKHCQDNNIVSEMPEKVCMSEMPIKRKLAAPIPEQPIP